MERRPWKGQSSKLNSLLLNFLLHIQSIGVKNLKEWRKVARVAVIKAPRCLVILPPISTWGGNSTQLLEGFVDTGDCLSIVRKEQQSRSGMQGGGLVPANSPSSVVSWYCSFINSRLSGGPSHTFENLGQLTLAQNCVGTSFIPCQASVPSN